MEYSAFNPGVQLAALMTQTLVRRWLKCQRTE